MVDVLVSISCITYNHEKYIKEALDSFIMQKTNFAYEILIHDDASTDRTPDIIREYQKRYPEIIKPILQTENQYSKGVKVGKYNRERAKGKYIAICEGDDYWTDPLKLQIQVEYMEQNPNCILCFHNANIILAESLLTDMKLIKNVEENKIYNAGQIAVLGFIPTASILYRKTPLLNIDTLDWVINAVVGDYPLQLLATSHGYAYYINRTMSAYRTGVPGSASSRFLKKSTDERIKYLNGFIDILDNFNEYTNFIYSDELEEARIPWDIKIAELKRDIKSFKERHKTYYNSLGALAKLKLYSKCYFPNLYQRLSKTKQKALIKMNRNSAR